MNTMGWTISDEFYKSWKAAIGESFKAPQIKYTPESETLFNKYYTSGTISLEATAQYGRTIFWKELKGKNKLIKPKEEKKADDKK